MNFRDYKTKLRVRGAMRRHASETGYTCPACGYHGDAMDEPDGMLPSRCPNCGIEGNTMWDDDPDLEQSNHPFQPDPNYNPQEWGEDWCPQCQSPMYWQNGAWVCTHCGWKGPSGWNQTPEDPSEMQHPDPWMDNEPGSLTLPEHWGGRGNISRMSDSETRARLSGMDDPTPDPEFDQQRAQMPEQHAQDQQNIVDAVKSITPAMQQFMRARGINEPDWEPLQHVIPPSHLGDWMWMGYGDNGQREYKHYHTRRYLNLLPSEEVPQQMRFDNYDRLHLFNRSYVPFLRFHQPDGAESAYRPVDMNYALSHAYEDIEHFTGQPAGAQPHPYPQGYPSYEWEHMEVPPWERPPYPQQQPGPSDIDPYSDLR